MKKQLLDAGTSQGGVAECTAVFASLAYGVIVYCNIPEAIGHKFAEAPRAPGPVVCAN